MKLIEIEGLRPCKKCGSGNVILQKNASKAFQVKCADCGNKTKWQRKTDAVIEWFNQ